VGILRQVYGRAGFGSTRAAVEKNHPTRSTPANSFAEKTSRYRRTSANTMNSRLAVAAAPPLGPAFTTPLPVMERMNTFPGKLFGARTRRALARPPPADKEESAMSLIQETDFVNTASRNPRTMLTADQPMDQTF